MKKYRNNNKLYMLRTVFIMYNRETLEILQESKKRRSRARADRVREYDRKLVKDEYNAFIIKESTDMELMIALDESGYEPSVENVLILREYAEGGSSEILDEGVKAAIDALKNSDAAIKLRRSKDNLKQASAAYKAADKTMRGKSVSDEDLEKYKAAERWRDLANSDVKANTKARRKQFRTALINKDKYYADKVRAEKIRKSVEGD